MQKSRLLTVLCFILLSGTLTAQFKLDNWQTYTSMLNVNTASIDSKGRLWAGTNGGVYYYNPDNGEIKKFTNIDGLLGNEISCLKCNIHKKTIFIGTIDGYLDILDEDYNWRHITDINSAKFPNPVIKDIYFRNELAYIAGGFGLTVFDMNENVFRETVLRLGKFQLNTMINAIEIFNDELWIATEAGVARVKIGASIADPQTWTNYTDSDGLPDNDVTGICVYQNTIYVSTPHNLCKFEADTFKIVYQIQEFDNINSLHSFDNKLFYSTEGYVLCFDGSPLPPIKRLDNINRIFIDSNSSKPRIIVCEQEEGVGIINLENNDYQTFAPNSPYSNLFNNLIVDDYGNLWSATAPQPQGKGFMKFDKTLWTNFNMKNYSEMKSDYYWKIAPGPDGKILLSNWGKGFAILSPTNNDYSIKIYDTTNSPLLGISTNPAYIIAGESDVDRNGTIWICNYGEATSPGPVLVALDKNNVFYEFSNCSSSTKRGYTSLAIDFSGTKWIGSGSEAQGLLYFNEKGTWERGDDECGVITTSNSSLLNNEQTSLAVDKNGLLWIGAPDGLSILLNPSSVLNGTKPIVRQVRLIANQVVNDILVDALNNKWIATNTGVYVLDPDGIDTLAVINSKNSYLINDNVQSISSDPTTGIIYFGTQKGLSAARSFSIEPVQSFDIKCYPQPFNPITDEELIIEGLAAEAQLRVLTINGELVRTINARGRKSLWDGRDNNGNLVSSGVYMLVASSLNSDVSAVAKIAVLRSK